MTEHYNGLTPAEHERLSLLMEECAEVQQVIGKILRHGYESFHPDDPRKKSNRVLLEKEIGHVQYAIFLMTDRGDVSKNKIEQMKRLKNLTIGPYLHHNGLQCEEGVI